LPIILPKFSKHLFIEKMYIIFFLKYFDYYFGSIALFLAFIGHTTHAHVQAHPPNAIRLATWWGASG